MKKTRIIKPTTIKDGHLGTKGSKNKSNSTKIVPLDIETGNPKKIYCCFCLEEKENHRFIKCGHSWCIECDKKFTNSECPYCRYKFRKPIELERISRPQSEIVERQYNERIHNCNLCCLISTLVETLLHMIYFNNYCNDICIPRRSYVYKLPCYNVFFYCENYKCKNIRFISRPSINITDNKPFNLFLSIICAFILIFVILIFGRFWYLLLNSPRGSVFFCDMECMILTGLFGIFEFLFFGMLCLLIMSCILMFFNCFSKCVNIIFNLQIN
jgi:hypothetical protein